MGQEIELKLSVAPTALSRLLRHPLLLGVARRQAKLVNTYFDTPDFTLREHGIALRLRRQGRLLLQTVKCAGASAGGLSTRPEWETPYGGKFDFAAVDAGVVRRWLQRPRITGRLLPVFETNFTRTTWCLEPAPGSRVLLMLDRGWIAAGQRREVISELEIELAAGPVAAIFSVVDELLQRVVLTPAVLSKAERGYRLQAVLPLVPVKAVAVPLDNGMSSLTAFQAIALSCLDHLQRNHEGAVCSDDAEFIHQMRVASRRLRAAQRLFRPCSPTALAEPGRAAMRELMRKLGEARDLDVVVEEIVNPVCLALPGDARLAELVAALASRRTAAREAARQYLRSIDYSRLLLQNLRTLQTPETPGQAPDDAMALATCAAKQLRRLRRKLDRLALTSKDGDPVALHRLRIGVKRLRYASEFLAPLSPAKLARRRVDALTQLQEALGQLNDLAGAGRLLMECAGDRTELREAVALVGGWHAARHAQLLTSLPAQLRRLRRTKLPMLADHATSAK